jgi:hypothetical protein
MAGVVAMAGAAGTEAVITMVAIMVDIAAGMAVVDITAVAAVTTAVADTMAAAAVTMAADTTTNANICDRDGRLVH